MKNGDAWGLEHNARMPDYNLTGEQLVQSAIETTQAAEQPSESERANHELTHKVTRGWAQPVRRDWCGACEVGDFLWERYGPGSPNWSSIPLG